MQTCLNWDLKLFTAVVTKVKFFNHHSSERNSTATTWNSLKLHVIIINLTKRENMRIVPSLNIYPQGKDLVIYCIYFPSHPTCPDKRNSAVSVLIEWIRVLTSRRATILDSNEIFSLQISQIQENIQLWWYVCSMGLLQPHFI